MLLYFHLACFICSKLTGMAFRVPVQDVSVVDLTCRLEKGVSTVLPLKQRINTTRLLGMPKTVWLKIYHFLLKTLLSREAE